MTALPEPPAFGTAAGGPAPPSAALFGIPCSGKNGPAGGIDTARRRMRVHAPDSVPRMAAGGRRGRSKPGNLGTPEAAAKMEVPGRGQFRFSEAGAGRRAVAKNFRAEHRAAASASIAPRFLASPALPAARRGTWAPLPDAPVAAVAGCVAAGIGAVLNAYMAGCVGRAECARFGLEARAIEGGMP